MEQSLSTNLITQNERQTSIRQTIGYSVYQFAPPNLQGPGGEDHEGRGGDAGAGTASETCGTSL